MKPTQEELQLKSNDELDELVAIAQGWKFTDHYNQAWMDEGSIAYYKDEYHPTQNTTEGKAQCWDLMFKCGLTIDMARGSVYFNGGLIDFLADNPLQKAVVIAAILSLQGEDLP
jgi:hypothetical protein